MTVVVGDLCCGAGLGADGYHSVGLTTDGYDIEPQPHYPGPFTRADVREVLANRDLVRGWDAIHTSFPCQFATTAGHLRTAQGGTARFGDLLTDGLATLRRDYPDMPWVVENVDDNRGVCRRIMAPRDGEHLTMLCGSMFGLEVQRHRLFLTNFPVRRPAPTGDGVYAQQGCRHDRFPPDPTTGKPRPWGVYHVKGDKIPAGGRTATDEEHGRHVMGSRRLLPWDSLKEGFPPAYTAYVGADLLRHLTTRDRGEVCATCSTT